MASFLVKRGIWLGLAVMALIIVSVAAASFLAGGRVVKAGLVNEVERMTGQRFIVSQAPKISIFPSLTAEFSDVSIHSWQNASDQLPVVEVPTLRLSLSVLSALNGDVEITRATLNRPVFYSQTVEGGWQLPFSSKADFAKLIDAFKTSLDDAAQAQSVDAARKYPLKSLVINDGTIVLGSPLAGEQAGKITTINAQILLQAPGNSAALKAGGFWQGEPVDLELSTNDIVFLLAGKDTRTSLKLNSKFLTSQFTGITRLMPNPYLEGELSAEIPSLTHLSNWQHLSMPVGVPALGLGIKGLLKADAGKLQLENAQLLFGSNRGSGVLTLLPQTSPPALSGTLDFDVLDLGMTQPLFAPLPVENKSAGSFPVAVDLRVSADTATFGTLVLSKVAATIQSTPEANALDVNDASVFGGNLQLALKRQKNDQSADAPPQLELRILADDIDTAQLSQLGLLFDRWPQARGKLSAILRSSSGDIKNFMETAEGTVKLRLSEGNIPGIDSAAILKELRRGGFMALNANHPAILPFNELNIEGNLTKGTLQINPLKIGLPSALIDLSGAYAFKEDSLALTGSVMLEA
ncbi:MAG: AsmA family protein, partial [Notoacmeibacter sp.]